MVHKLTVTEASMIGLWWYREILKRLDKQLKQKVYTQAREILRT